MPDRWKTVGGPELVAIVEGRLAEDVGGVGGWQAFPALKRYQTEQSMVKSLHD